MKSPWWKLAVATAGTALQVAAAADGRIVFQSTALASSAEPPAVRCDSCGYSKNQPSPVGGAPPGRRPAVPAGPGSVPSQTQAVPGVVHLFFVTFTRSP